MSDKNYKPSRTVYIPMCADIVHEGHLNIINEGALRGEVIIGLLSDKAIAQKKRAPFMDYRQRFAVVSNLKGVAKVIVQDSPDYRVNLLALKPDFVIHGDDWLSSASRRKGRMNVLAALEEWGGKLIEVPYTEGISSTSIQKSIKERGILPGSRRDRFKELLQSKELVRIAEAHNGLSARIVENSEVKDSSGMVSMFDAIWISSLTDSAAKGRPDTEVVDSTSRLLTINEVLESSTKPLVVDADTGGKIEHFVSYVKTLERLGVSAVVIEDKKGLKRNSLHDDPEQHTQEDPLVFADKIRAARAARLSSSFMVIARIESLILGKGQEDAIGRAEVYIKAGADAVVIHSKMQDGEEIKKFARAYSGIEGRVPLVVIPTSYSSVPEEDFIEWGADIVIYANHLLRAAYSAMVKAAESILENKRAHEIDQTIASVADLLAVSPEDENK